MKKVILKRKAIALALATIPLLMGCGSSSSSSGSGGYVPGIAGGGCISSANITTSVAQITIPFSGTNVQFSPLSLRAGQIPYGQAYGTVTLSGGVAGGIYRRNFVDGSLLTMNIQATNATTTGGLYGTSAANITGSLQLSSQVVQTLYTQFGGGYNSLYPYPGQPVVPTTPTANICVTGLAMDYGVTGTSLFGQTYLYMNNTNSGWSM